MASFCRRHSYRGGKPPTVLLARLRSAPTAPVGIPPATLAILVRAQVQLLRTLLGTIAELDAAIITRVAAHPRAQAAGGAARCRHHQPRPAAGRGRAGP